jgi:hypothetical protein
MKFHAKSILFPDRKRLRLGDRLEVQEDVNSCFKNVAATDIPVTGPVLKGKTQALARQSGVQDFEASSRWLILSEKKKNFTKYCPRQ